MMKWDRRQSTEILRVYPLCHRLKTKKGFSDIKIELFEPDAEVRKILVANMRQSNLPHLTVSHSLFELKQTIRQSERDVVMLSIDRESEQCCALVRAIRANEICSNPFPIVVALVTSPDQSLAKLVLNAGFDDLLVKPVSAAMLIERTTRFASGRKAFVITSDYIGPDRRENPRENKGMPSSTFDPPNPVRMRLHSDQGGGMPYMAIDHGTAILNTLKMERNGDATGHLAKSIAALLSGQPDAASLDRARLEIEKLALVVEDIRRRSHHGGIYANVAKLGDALHDLVITLRTTLGTSSKATLDPEDLRLLPAIAASVAKAIRLDSRTSAGG